MIMLAKYLAQSKHLICGDILLIFGYNSPSLTEFVWFPLCLLHSFAQQLFLDQLLCASILDTGETLLHQNNIPIQIIPPYALRSFLTFLGLGCSVLPLPVVHSNSFVFHLSIYYAVELMIINGLHYQTVIFLLAGQRLFY